MKYFLKDIVDLEKENYVQGYWISEEDFKIMITSHKYKALTFNSRHVAQRTANYINEKGFVKIVVIEEE